MLRGKFWLTGLKQAVQVDDHHQYVKAQLLRLPGGHLPSMREATEGLNQDACQLLREQNVPEENIAVLAKGGDFRAHALEHWHWIRVAGNKGTVWEWNTLMAELLRGNTQFWAAQNMLEAGDILELEEACPGGGTVRVHVETTRLPPVLSIVSPCRLAKVN